jgi:hypothetical protein
MNATLSGRAASERLGMISDRPKSDASSDVAWMVLEAANDFGDDTTVEACRRVIDASLSGTPASQSDLHVVSDYFR